MSTSSDRISVIVPCCNDEKYIVECLESVSGQTLKPYEIVVCDDGSRDKTLQIVQAWVQHQEIPVAVVVHEHNLGIPKNLNSGIRASTGDYVSFVAADDYWEPEKLEKEFELLKQTGSEWVYSKTKFLWMQEDGEHRFERYGNTSQDLSGDIFEDVVRWRIDMRNYLVSRKALDDVGWFDESIGMYEDWDLCIRLARKYAIAHVPEYLLVYRQHGEATHRAPMYRHFPEIGKVLRKTKCLMAPGNDALRLETFCSVWAEENWKTEKDKAVHRKVVASLDLEYTSGGIGKLGEGIIFVLGKDSSQASVLNQVLGNHPDICIADQSARFLPFIVECVNAESSASGNMLQGIEISTQQLQNGTDDIYEAVRRMLLRLYKKSVLATGKAQCVEHIVSDENTVFCLSKVFPNAQYLVFDQDVDTAGKTNRVGSGNSVLSISSDTMETDPLPEIERICSFTGIPFFHPMLDGQYGEDKSTGLEEGCSSDLVSQGEAAYIAGDIKKAETRFLEAYTIDNNDIIACNNLVVLYWESGDTDQALYYLDHAMKLDSTNRDVVVNGGQILSAYGYAADAAGLYDAYLSNNQGDEEVLALYKSAVSDANSGGQPDAATSDMKPAATIDAENIDRIDFSLPENQVRAPKISIVIPSFNQGVYLETTIRSVLDQGYPNLELIVMDGGSTDDSVNIIETYEEHITYWQSQRDEGQYWAVNEGFRRSTGEIMAWINSDDKLHVNSLNTMASIFTRRADVNWVTGTPNIMEEEGFITWICEQTPVFSQNNYLQKKYDFPSFIQQEGTFWRRSLWDQAGATLQTELQMAGDLELWARFFRYSPLHTATVCTGCFRQQKNQKTAKAMTLYRAEAEEILDREIQRFNQSARAPLAPVKPIHVNNPDRPINSSRQLVRQMAILLPGSKTSLTLYSAISPRHQKNEVVNAMHGSVAEPLVTAIVSTYNSEKFLRGCLDDLEAQTLAPRLEIIVVDSGSKQSEGAIVKEYQDRYTNIRYIRTENRETIYSAWNRAARAARGRYLTNANTDDRHRSDAYERMVDALEANHDIALVYADVNVTRQENAAFSEASVEARFSWPEFDARQLFSVCYIGPQPMWRRVLHEQYGYFDPRMQVAGDYEFWLRLAAREKFLHLNEELGLYLSSESSIEHAFAGVGAQESEKARQRNWPDSWGEMPPLSEGYLVPVGDKAKSHSQVLPLVSVIMATKNRREMLAYALRSVQDQSYLNWEIVLVNDGGEDISDVFQQLGMEARVHYLRNEESQGQAKARNRAFKSASGDIITILDDDDMFQPHHLRTVVDSFQDGSSHFVYTDAELVQETLRGGKRKEVSRSNPYTHEAYSRKQLHIDNYIPINTWAFRKECLASVNGFDESLTCCEDWEFLLKLSQQHEFQHVSQVTVEVRHRIDVQDNVTRQRLSETEAVYKEIYGRYCTFDDPEVEQGRKQAIERIRDQLDRLADEEGVLLPDSAEAVFSVAAENDDRHLLELDQNRFLERVESNSYHCPVVHLITVVNEASVERLIDTIRSLSSQFYSGWGLTVISGLESPGGVFDEMGNLEWITAADQVGTARDVMQESIGEWVVPFVAGNRLAPGALSTLVEYSNQYQNLRFIYTDEIAGDWDEQTSTYYKPDFDREFLLNNPYLGQLCFLRKDSMEFDSIQGVDPQTLGFEQCLRITRRYGDEVVGHIPEILNCLGDASDGDEGAGSRNEIYKSVLSEYFRSEPADVPVLKGYLPDTFMIDYPLSGNPSVCIVIYAAGNAEAARQTVVNIIDKTAYKNYCIKVGVNNQDGDVFIAIGDDRIQVDAVNGYKSKAEYINVASDKSDSDYFLFIEPGVMSVQDVWLSRMLAHGQRSGVAAMGARLISPEQRIVHAGILTGIGPYGVGSVAFDGSRMSDNGYMNRAQVAQSMGAVSSACMLVRSDWFAESDGFDIDLDVPFYQDIDLCQKLRSEGRRIVWTPFVTMLYTGPDLASYRGDGNAEYVISKAQVLSERWLKHFANDPAYNRNLGLKQAGYSTDRNYPPTWNPDIRDIPRVTGFGAGSRGSWQYRVVQPMNALRRSGSAYCNQTPFVEKHRVLLPTPVEIERAKPDTLLMHNMLHDDCIERLEQYKKVNNSFVVFGQDDLMFALPPKNPFSKTMYKDVKKRIRRCLKLSDRLLVTTNALADGLQGMVDDIRVIPNYLDDTIWKGLSSKRQVSSRPRVGWAGAQQHLGDLLLLEEVVKETASEVDWVFFGMCPDSLRPYVKEVHDGVRFENYHGKLASLNLDLAVAPLEHNRFNEAKSNLRILEYGALGWPVIASDIEPYRDAPVCLVRSQASAWINAIRDRLHDLDTTYKEGDRLRAWVHDNWMLHEHVTEWLSALDQGSRASAIESPKHQAMA